MRRCCGPHPQGPDQPAPHGWSVCRLSGEARSARGGDCRSLPVRDNLPPRARPRREAHYLFREMPEVIANLTQSSKCTDRSRRLAGRTTDPARWGLGRGRMADKTGAIRQRLPAGEATDTLSRIFCHKMTEISGQNFVVENRVGAGGTVGADAVAKSQPDGYTLGLGGIANNVLAVGAYAKLPMMRKDFTCISGIWHLPNVLAAQEDGLPGASPGLQQQSLIFRVHHPGITTATVSRPVRSLPSQCPSAAACLRGPRPPSRSSPPPSGPRRTCRLPDNGTKCAGPSAASHTA